MPVPRLGLESGLVTVRVVPVATLKVAPLTSMRMPRVASLSAKVAVFCKVPRLNTSWSETSVAGAVPRRAGLSIMSVPVLPSPTQVLPV
jgi:hypothetical protein